MSILIVLSGFLAIVVVGSILVAVNDLLERWWTRYSQAELGVAVRRSSRAALERGHEARQARRGVPGRRHAPRDVIVVHTGRIRSVDA